MASSSAISIGSKLSALLVILALANLADANGHASLGLDIQSVKFEDLVVDPNTGRLASLDLVSTPMWPKVDLGRDRAWPRKAPFCYGRVWVALQTSTGKMTCPHSAKQAYGCGLKACISAWEPKPWFKRPKPDLEEEDEEKEHYGRGPAPAPGHHHHHDDDDHHGSPAPAPGHHHHHDDDDHEEEDHDHHRKGRPHPHPWTRSSSVVPAPAPAPDRGVWKFPKPSCSADWKVDGLEVSLHEFEPVGVLHHDHRSSLGYFGGDLPCKWVHPTCSGGFRCGTKSVLVCVKCAEATKRPPVMRTQEMSLSDHGDEPVEFPVKLPAAATAAHGAQVDPDLISSLS